VSTKPYVLRWECTYANKKEEFEMELLRLLCMGFAGVVVGAIGGYLIGRAYNR